MINKTKGRRICVMCTGRSDWSVKSGTFGRAHTLKPIAFAAPRRPLGGRAVPRRAEGKYYSNSLCTSAIRPPLADALISQGLTKHRSALLVSNLELSATAPRPNLCFSRISVLLFSQKGREGSATGTMPVILLPLRRWLSDRYPPFWPRFFILLHIGNRYFV